jgi:hypothetical protein
MDVIRCKGTTKQGKPCQIYINLYDGYCDYHRPKIPKVYDDINDGDERCRAICQSGRRCKNPSDFNNGVCATHYVNR